MTNISFSKVYIKSIITPTGHYMKSSSGDPAILMSPSFTLDGSKSCVQFSFFSDNGASNASMLIQLWEESEQATMRTVWNRTRDSDGYWQNGQFQMHIPAGNFRLAFLGESIEDGFLAVDNITLIQGECPKLGKAKHHSMSHWFLRLTLSTLFWDVTAGALFYFMKYEFSLHLIKKGLDSFYWPWYYKLIYVINVKNLNASLLSRHVICWYFIWNSERFHFCFSLPWWFLQLFRTVYIKCLCLWQNSSLCKWRRWNFALR